MRQPPREEGWTTRERFLFYSLYSSWFHLFRHAPAGLEEPCQQAEQRPVVDE